MLKEISQPIPDGGVAANSRRATLTTLNFRHFLPQKHLFLKIPGIYFYCLHYVGLQNVLDVYTTIVLSQNVKIPPHAPFFLPKISSAGKKKSQPNPPRKGLAFRPLFTPLPASLPPCLMLTCSCKKVSSSAAIPSSILSLTKSVGSFDSAKHFDQLQLKK